MRAGGDHEGLPLFSAVGESEQRGDCLVTHDFQCFDDLQLLDIFSQVAASQTFVNVLMAR